MAAITAENSGQIHVLEGNHLIGRSLHCSLRLEDASVSGEHAALRWSGEEWLLKDLASRYGTFLNGQPVRPGVPLPLAKGARLAFGRDETTWFLSDVGPPEVMVAPVAGGSALFRADGMIAIPSPEEPLGVVYQDPAGRWVLDVAGALEVLSDHRSFVVDGRQWRLCNTSPLLSTSMRGDAKEVMAIDAVELHFTVSRDEEHVEVVVLWNGRRVALAPRSHHYVLLTLARQRLHDIANGVEPGDAGWIAHEELLRSLQLTPERFNLDIFRARRQFASAGFAPAVDIVERRPGREVRIGVAQLFIRSA